MTQEEKQISLNYELPFNENPSDIQIIEALIKHLKEQDGFLTAIDCVSTKSILSWLEKQKEEEGYEAIPVESTFEYKLGFKAGKESEKQKERKPVDFPTTDEEVNEFLETHSKVEVPEKYKTPEFVFSKQEYESYPIISKDTTSVKPAEWSEDFDKEVEKIHKRYPEVSFAKLTRIAYHFSKWANRRKDIEWSEEDEEVMEDLYNFVISDFIQDHIHETRWKPWKTTLERNRQNRLKSLRPQPKQEWSEEDEKNLNLCIEFVESCEIDYDAKPHYSTWLKSLPERFNLEPKEGWNEEDEENMQAIVETIKRHWLTIPGNTLIDWLKSLRPVSKESLQPHWKPSEEQMESLAYAIQVLNSNPHPKSAKAYQDLQTLYKNIKYGN